MICVNTAILESYERSQIGVEESAERKAQEFMNECLGKFKAWFENEFDQTCLSTALEFAAAKDKYAEAAYGYGGDDKGVRRALDMLSEDKFNAFYRLDVQHLVITKEYCNRAIVSFWVNEYVRAHDFVEQFEIVEHILGEHKF
jgi:hypothetical protein